MIATLFHVTLLGAGCREPLRRARGASSQLHRDVRAVARRCGGPLAEDYRIVKERAGRAVRRGVELIGNKWAISEDLLNLGLAYLVERERGAPCRPYVDALLCEWSVGSPLQRREGTAFGYHAVTYD